MDLNIKTIRKKLLKLDAEKRADFFRKVKQLMRDISSLEYRCYRDDDSPKGENIPGVRYRKKIATLQL